MSDQPKKPVNRIYWFSIRMSVTTGLCFLSTVVCISISEITRTIAALVILSYFAYMIFETYKEYCKIDRTGSASGKRGVLWALSFTGMEFFYALIAVIVGVLIAL